jgi:hypothetical protein
MVVKALIGLEIINKVVKSLLEFCRYGVDENLEKQSWLASLEARAEKSRDAKPHQYIYWPRASLSAFPSSSLFYKSSSCKSGLSCR